MAPLLKKDFNMEELETRHSDITALYDLAEDLIATVESDFVKDPEAQLDVVEPLIRDLSDATDVLSEEFVFLAEGQRHKAQGRASKSRIESALRKIFSAVHDYQVRVRDVSKKAHGAIQNIADPVVQKIQRQVDKVIVAFMEFIQISLANLMGKAELEALKARDTRIAMMMHQMAMSAQQ